MSESLIKQSVPGQLRELAEIAEHSCGEVICHQILNTKFAYVGPSNQTLFNYQVPDNLAYVILGIDIKTLYDETSGDFTGDFRSTDDINPFGPYFAGSGGVGQITILDNNQALPGGSVANDIGVINVGIMIVIQSGHTFGLQVNPNIPAAKKVTLVCRTFGYLTTSAFGTSLEKKTTRILTL